MSEPSDRNSSVASLAFSDTGSGIEPFDLEGTPSLGVEGSGGELGLAGLIDEHSLLRDTPELSINGSTTLKKTSGRVARQKSLPRSGSAVSSSYMTEYSDNEDMLEPFDFGIPETGSMRSGGTPDALEPGDSPSVGDTSGSLEDPFSLTSVLMRRKSLDDSALAATSRPTDARSHGKSSEADTALDGDLPPPLGVGGDEGFGSGADLIAAALAGTQQHIDELQQVQSSALLLTPASSIRDDQSDAASDSSGLWDEDESGDDGGPLATGSFSRSSGGKTTSEHTPLSTSVSFSSPMKTKSRKFEQQMLAARLKGIESGEANTRLWSFELPSEEEPQRWHVEFQEALAWTSVMTSFVSAVAGQGIVDLMSDECESRAELSHSWAAGASELLVGVIARVLDEFLPADETRLREEVESTSAAAQHILISSFYPTQMRIRIHDEEAAARFQFLNTQEVTFSQLLKLHDDSLNRIEMQSEEQDSRTQISDEEMDIREQLKDELDTVASLGSLQLAESRTRDGIAEHYMDAVGTLFSLSQIQVKEIEGRVFVQELARVDRTRLSSPKHINALLVDIVTGVNKTKKRKKF